MIKADIAELEIPVKFPHLNPLRLRRRQRRHQHGRAFLVALVAAGLAAAMAAGPASAATVPTPPGHNYTPGSETEGGAAVIAYTASDGSVWVKDLVTRVYTPAGGHLVTGPALVTDSGSAGPVVVVFGEGTDHALWENVCTPGGSCGSWVSLGGTITSRPGAVFRGPGVGDYSVYARGADGAVWGRDHTPAGWSAWYTTGGSLLAGTGPSAAFLGGIYILAVGTNSGLYLQQLGVTGFVPVGGFTTATPALTAIATALVGFVRGADGVAYYHRFLNTSPGWHSMAGAFTSGLSAVAINGTTTLTFGLGTDSRVYGDGADWTSYPPNFLGWVLSS
jgi:hypothetical protein